MRPRRNPVPRARDAWVWLGGFALLGILGAGVTAAAVALWETIDIRQLVPQLATAATPLPSPAPPRPAARDGWGFEVVLLDSPRNRTFFPDSAYYASALAAWEELIRDAGGNVRRVSTAAELQDLTPEDLLVLAEAPCLSEQELATVRAHLARAGGIVANWAVGARDAECGWRGWGAVAEITGAEDVREISPRDALFLTVPAGLPLSPGLDAGTRIELWPDHSLAVRVSGPRVYWSDWALNPKPDETGGGADVAALATYSEQGGRVAWLGFRIGQAATAMDSLRLRRLAQNGIWWAAGLPIAAPAAWPQARRAALVFALDVEDEPHNAVAVADMLRQRGVPGSFYAVSRLVREEEDLAARLVASGEVGSHTVDHAPVAGLTAQDQQVRLRRSWTDIQAWTGRSPLGLHPPEERFDQNTVAAWASAGGVYVMGTNEARSGTPELHGGPASGVILLPRLVRDDYSLVVQGRVIRASKLAQAFLADIRKLRAIGGLAIVSLHSQIMRPGPRVEALGSVIDSARAQGDWWIGEAGEIAQWWKARSGVDLSFVTPEPGGLPGFAPAGLSDLLVRAQPHQGIDGLWIDVVIPRRAEGLMPMVDGLPVDFAETDWGVRVPVGHLPAGEVRRISFLVPGEDDEGSATQ